MIEIINQQHRYWLNARKYKELLKRLSTRYKLDDPEITLVFVDNRAIKKLNKKYLTGL